MDIHFDPIQTPGPASPPPTSTPPTGPKQAHPGIMGKNFLLFLGYYVLGLVGLKIAPNSGAGALITSAYIVHALILFLIAAVVTVRKGHSFAWDYAMTGLALLVIGFGACTVAIYTGLASF